MWIPVAVIAPTVGCVSTILLVFIWRWCRHNKTNRRNLVEPATASLTTTEETSTTHHHQLDQGSKNKTNHGKRTHTLFSWADNPSMPSDAVENGWSRFAFTSYTPSPSKRASLLGSCAPPDHGKEPTAEISWEVSRGSSSEFMQKVRLNPGMKSSHQNSLSVASLIRTALPLPGPPFGNYAFPQQAYFEITILYASASGYDSDPVGKSSGDGDKTKLIVKGNSEALVHVTSGNRRGAGGNYKINSVDEMKLDVKESGKKKKKSESVTFSLGLAIGGSVLLKIPGSYPGSIGFNSNGSVYLDGMKLVFESEKAEWIGTDRVIGCGFDPKQNKVFFTLDSELVHVIHCQSEEFGCPLYPILAANIDIMVLVNFGQSAFKYAPANAQRTPNPYFVAPLVNFPRATLGYDDSRELFSMGRIDSQWLSRSTTKGSHNNGYHNQMMDYDEESESDLFEIVLDGSGKSLNTTL